jgi:transcriptional regulator with XRE-family HTH domain
LSKRISTRQILAENLRRIRLEKGVSQEKLGELSGLHRTYVGSVERAERNVSIDNVEALAAALEVSVVTLLGEVKRK